MSNAILTKEKILELLNKGFYEKAAFSMGCFWGPDVKFGAINGVVQTRVGYSGSLDLNPNYGDIKGHAETIQIIYDPKIVNYEKLLSIFIESYSPGRGIGQYRLQIFYSNDEQKEKVFESKAKFDDIPIIDMNSMFGKFWDAEDYHQKYKLRKNKEFVDKMVYHYGKDWDQSNIATKLNAYGSLDLDLKYWLSKIPQELSKAFRLGNI